MKDVLSVVASNPEGHFLAWRHLKAHWKGLQNLFGNGTFSMGALIGVVTSHFSAPYDLHEVGIRRHLNIGGICLWNILYRRLSKIFRFFFLNGEKNYH